MKSEIYSFKHIKTESKGNWWIPALLLLGFLLAFPVAELLKLGNWKDIGYTVDQTRVLYENLWKDGLAITGSAVAAIAAVCNSIYGFRYLYSRSKTDFYHSLPVKRAGMFWQKIYVGVIYYLVPYLIMEFLAVCIGAAKGFFSLKLLFMAAELLGLHLLVYFLIYFCIVLILCITGNALAGILSIIFAVAYSGALSMLLGIYGETFFRTYYSADTYSIPGLLKGTFSPVGLAMQLLQKYRAGESYPFSLFIIAITVLVVILTRIAYVKRPSEASGKTMVYKWTEVVLRFMVVVPFGLGIGWIFYELTVGRTRVIWWIFGLILGTVISHGLMETIYQMDFRGFFSKKFQLCIAGILVIICAFGYKQDLLGYDRYCPKQEDIASVNVGMMSFLSDSNAVVEENSDGSYSITESYKWYKPAFALSDKNSGIGDETYEALKEAAVGTREFSSEEYYGNASYSVYVKYTLKSGRNIWKSYVIKDEVVEKLLRGLYNEENFKDQKYGFLKLDPEYIDELDLVAADSVSHTLYNDSDRSEGRKEFIEAMKKDVEAATTEELMEVPTARLDIMYRLPGKTDADHMSPDPQYDTSVYGDWSIYVYPSFKNTLEILRKTGYPLSVEELDITKVKIHYTDLDDDEDPDEIVEYDSPEEIKELEAAMSQGTVGVFSNARSKIASNLTAELEIKDHENTVIADLLKDKLPDFVIDKMKEKGIDMEESAVTETVIGGADEETSIDLK